MPESPQVKICGDFGYEKKGILMRNRRRRYKRKLVLAAVVIVAAVALYKPEYAENAARAFLLLIGAM